ncbi:MAG: rRNA maturation RNase YbeY [Holosporaceae bacterium]|jgi:probable rRNA maturation factor|nr:rRNA maturation RNase YbeY [Holosporaceae bacterium]
MNLAISIDCDSWDEEEVRSVVNECAHEVFSEIKINGDNVEICFLFTNNEEIRILNKTYRGVNRPTNVLSFPSDFPAEEEKDRVCILGSIALAFETIEKESREQKKLMLDHLRHLVVHGLLHLLRYDHEKASQAKRMEALEIKILGKLNVQNPYLYGEKSYHGIKN